jgi:hypothetical protein
MTLDEAQRDLRATRENGESALLEWFMDDAGESFKVVRYVNGQRLAAASVKGAEFALSLVNEQVMEAKLRGDYANQLSR